jgi:hypothetical protein
VNTWTAWWSERAQRAEQDSDRMAALLQLVLERRGDVLPWDLWAGAQDAVRDWRANAQARHRPLPAGPTRIGSLSSGGIDI